MYNTARDKDFRTTYDLRNTSPRRNSFAVPTLPCAIPDVHTPPPRWLKTRSRELITKATPPNEKATLVVVLHGRVKPPWESEAEPGIRACKATASEGGIMTRVVPCSIYHLVSKIRTKKTIRNGRTNSIENSSPCA